MFTQPTFETKNVNLSNDYFEYRTDDKHGIQARSISGWIISHPHFQGKSEAGPNPENVCRPSFQKVLDVVNDEPCFQLHKELYRPPE